MSCSGLHCAGCAGGAGVPPIAFVYAYGAAWVAGHVVQVAVTSAVCGTLAVAAVVALMRWCDRRQAAHVAAHPLVMTRVDVLPPRGISTAGGDSSMPAEIRTAGSDSARLAIGPAEVHLHFHGLTDAEQAEVMSRALGR